MPARLRRAARIPKLADRERRVLAVLPAYFLADDLHGLVEQQTGRTMASTVLDRFVRQMIHRGLVRADGGGFRVLPLAHSALSVEA